MDARIDAEAVFAAFGGWIVVPAHWTQPSIYSRGFDGSEGPLISLSLCGEDFTSISTGLAIHLQLLRIQGSGEPAPMWVREMYAEQGMDALSFSDAFDDQAEVEREGIKLPVDGHLRDFALITSGDLASATAELAPGTMAQIQGPRSAFESLSLRRVDEEELARLLRPFDDSPRPVLA